MKIRYSRRATSDLSSIHQYLSERSPIGARHVMTGISFGAILAVPRRQASMGFM
jgi:hypothetical protein